MFAPIPVLNVAVGKAAMQSSTVGQGSAQKAVDGSMLSLQLQCHKSLVNYPANNQRIYAIL